MNCKPYKEIKFAIAKKNCVFTFSALPRSGKMSSAIDFCVTGDRGPYYRRGDHNCELSADPTTRGFWIVDRPGEKCADVEVGRVQKVKRKRGRPPGAKYSDHNAKSISVY